jgi:thiosulfate dehydrogenase (quinone) large subunit
MSTQAVAGRADPLSASRGSRVLIGVVRVEVALLWIQNAAWKAPPDFGALRGFTEDGSGIRSWRRGHG